MCIFILFANPMQAQTPQQRKANERYARQEAAKRGKPDGAIKQKSKFNPPISPLWIGALRILRYYTSQADFCLPGLLVFVLCGGIIFELLRLFF